jgi:5'-methylthioadenosine phosphorylase
MVTDYDCWHQSEEAVSVEAVIRVLQQNVRTARAVIGALCKRLPDARKSPTANALQNAILTAPEHIPASTRRALSPLLSKYLPA